MSTSTTEQPPAPADGPGPDRLPYPHLSVYISEETAQNLHWLVAQTGESATRVVGQALNLFAMLAQAQQDGSSVEIISRRGRRRELVLHGLRPRRGLFRRR